MVMDEVLTAIRSGRVASRQTALLMARNRRVPHHHVAHGMSCLGYNSREDCLPYVCSQ